MENIAVMVIDKKTKVIESIQVTPSAEHIQKFYPDKLCVERTPTDQYSEGDTYVS
jgi:hypothetical protein